jgi:hypothetical protein
MRKLALAFFALLLMVAVGCDKMKTANAQPSPGTAPQTTADNSKPADDQAAPADNSVDDNTPASGRGAEDKDSKGRRANARKSLGL